MLFLGIEGFEAFVLASLPALQRESGRRIYNLAREECAPLWSKISANKLDQHFFLFGYLLLESYGKQEEPWIIGTWITAVLIAHASNRFEIGFPGCELIYSSRVGDGAKRFMTVACSGSSSSRSLGTTVQMLHLRDFFIWVLVRKAKNWVLIVLISKQLPVLNVAFKGLFLFGFWLEKLTTGFCTKTL